MYTPEGSEGVSIKKASYIYIYIYAAIAEHIDINFNTNSIFQNQF